MISELFLGLEQPFLSLSLNPFREAVGKSDFVFLSKILIMPKIVK